VRGLVLIGSAGLGREIAPSIRILSLPILGEIIERPTPEGLRRVMRNLILYNPANLEEEWLAALFQQRSRPGAAKALLQFLRVGVNAWGQKPSARLDGRLGELKTPLLLAWGRQDRVVPVAHGQRAVQRSLSATLEVFDDCGHWPYFEHPNTFVQTVTQFLATISR
jgi:4,5:9,10-diseco-3-hydroxy-5,9,17-trioxoandrosta-1(10),2-diene-4-oate hydrolase